MDFYLILALGPRNGFGYCVVNRHKVKGEIITIIMMTVPMTMTMTMTMMMMMMITLFTLQK